MHDKEKSASTAESITVVLAIPYTTTIGEGAGTIVHILAHITGKLVRIVPVTPDTVFFFFSSFDQTVGAT